MSTLDLTAPAPASGAARQAARLLRWLEQGLGAICALLLAVLLVVVLATVLLRYVFSTGLLGAEDAGIWLHVALIAAGAPLAINSALAMRLDIFVRRMPAAGQQAADIAADVFSVLTGLVLLFGGATIAARPAASRHRSACRNGSVSVSLERAADWFCWRCCSTGWLKGEAASSSSPP